VDGVCKDARVAVKGLKNADWGSEVRFSGFWGGRIQLRFQKER